MQKLPEVPNRKKGWRMHKRKKASSWQRGTDYLSLSGSDQRFDNIVTFWCLGTTHTSLGVALVSPFHPVAVLSRSVLCWNIKDPLLNYKLTLTGLWQTSKKKLTLMLEIPNADTYIHENDKRIFDILNGGFNHFYVFRKNSLIHGMVVEPSK